jgi:ADP-heptose:LPS heptosyltransferase
MDNRSVLVIRLSSMGDIIRAVPTLKSLKENFQRVVFVAEDRFSEIARMYPFYDRAIFFPRKNLNLSSFKKFLLELRSEKFDLTLDIHGIFKSAAIARLSHSKKIAGYPKNFSKEFSHFFYTDKIPCGFEKAISRYERYEKALNYLGIEPKEQSQFYPPLISNEAENFAKDFLNKNGVQKNRFAFLFIGASKKQKFKRWPVFRFVKLAALLEKEMNLKSVFAYGPDESNLFSEFGKDLLTLEPCDLMKTSAIILNSSLFVGADTGLMHLSALSGIKTVAVMGTTDPLINKPYGKNSVVSFKEGIRKECQGISCSHSECMAKITETDVFEKVKQLFEKYDAF